MLENLPTVSGPQVDFAWRSTVRKSALYRGDCMAVMSQLPDNTVDCIWTDPPYFLSNGGMTCVGGQMVSVNKGNWDKSRGFRRDHEYNRQWIAECQRILRPGGSLWISGTVHNYLSVGTAMLELGLVILNDVVWEKPAPPPNLGCRCFTHSTEILLWATIPVGGKKRHTFNYEAMREENGGKQMKNLWRIAPPMAEEKRFGKHPTQKPERLVRRCLAASTAPGSIVFDPFAGSGTTGVAALRLGRRFFGVEIDSGFAALAALRLQEAADVYHLELAGVDKVS